MFEIKLNKLFFDQLKLNKLVLNFLIVNSTQLIQSSIHDK